MNVASETPDLLSISQAAIKLGVSAPTIRRWIHHGQLAAVKLGEHPTSPIRIPRVSVEHFITHNIVEPV